MAKHPFFSLLPLVEQRRGAGSSAAPGPAASGCDGGQGKGKMGEGVAVGRFPHLIWVEVACGGAAMVAGGGTALTGAAAALQGFAAVRTRGKRTRGPRGS